MGLHLFTIIAAFIAFSTNKVLAANKCYSCSTSYDPKCASPFQPSQTTQTCVTTSNANMKCAAYSYILGGQEITYRGCKTQINSCADIANALDKENKKMTGCSICDQDLCNTQAPDANSSRPITISVSIETLLLLAVIKFIINI